MMLMRWSSSTVACQMARGFSHVRCVTSPSRRVTQPEGLSETAAARLSLRSDTNTNAARFTVNCRTSIRDHPTTSDGISTVQNRSRLHSSSGKTIYSVSNLTFSKNLPSNVSFRCNQYRQLTSTSCYHSSAAKDRHHRNNVLLNSAKVFVAVRGMTARRSSVGAVDEPSEEDLMASLTRQRIVEAGMVDEAFRKAPNTVTDSAGWIIRLAIDNGYASFCRNAYLASMVAIAVNMQEHVIPYAKEVTFLFLLMGAGQLVYGTAAYTYTVLKLRKRTFTSRCTAFSSCSFALLHLFLWSGAVLIYIGYADDESGEDKAKTSSELGEPIQKV